MSRTRGVALKPVDRAILAWLTGDVDYCSYRLPAIEDATTPGEGGPDDAEHQR